MSRPTVRRNFTGKPGIGANGYPADNPPIICKECGEIMDEETDDGLCEPCESKTHKSDSEFFDVAKTVTKFHAGVLGVGK